MFLESGLEAIWEWAAFVKGIPTAQRAEASQDYADFDHLNDVKQKLTTLQSFLYDLRRQTYDLEVFIRAREA